MLRKSKNVATFGTVTVFELEAINEKQLWVTARSSAYFGWKLQSFWFFWALMSNENAKSSIVLIDAIGNGVNVARKYLDICTRKCW